MRGILAGVLSAVLAGASCGQSPTVGCDPCRTSAIAFGTVEYAGGTPLVRVPVLVRAYSESFGEEFRGGEMAYTDSPGNFRVRVSSLYAPHTAHCFRLTVNADALTGWPTETAEVQGSLDFREGERAEMMDSIRLDITVGG